MAANKGGISIYDHMRLISIHGTVVYLRDVRLHEILNEKLLAGWGWKLVKTG
jgi:hypothetical protein